MITMKRLIAAEGLGLLQRNSERLFERKLTVNSEKQRLGLGQRKTESNTSGQLGIEGPS